MQIYSHGHMLSSIIALFSLILQLAKFQRCLILWLADTSHNLIPSIGPFHGSITNSEIRTVSALWTNTLCVCVFMSSPYRWCCQACNVSEVFAWIKVSSTINLVWRLREPYKQQDSSPSLTGRQPAPKQTHTYIAILLAHGHLGFDLSLPMALRFEVYDPVHHILNACLNGRLNPTENQHNGGAVLGFEPQRKDNAAAANSLEAS